ncbi:MAG TPA: hypothetical protein VGA78_12420 [Gemmatimonadales bacterium]
MLALLALSLLAYSAGNQDTAGRVAGWQADLQFLLTQARQVHAGPGRPAHRPEFEQAVSGLFRRVPGLSDERIVVEIQRLMTLLGDGHSIVYLAPTPRIPLSRLPIDMYWFSDGVYVVGGMGEGEQLIGSRVVQLGGRNAEDLLRELEPYISRDNAIAFKNFGPFYLSVPAFLDALGAAGQRGAVALTVANAQGRTRTLLLAAGPMRGPLRKLAPPRAAPSPPPMYLERVEVPYWLRRLPEHQTVYVQFNQVMDAGSDPLARFAQRLTDTLSTPGVSSVIVDVRHNNGGDNTLLAPLINALASFERSRSGNRIFVLTSRTTFSAAQNFINRLERAAHPVFAGEPSMSSPNFTGEDHEVRLPYSGLMLSISNRYWQDSEPADRRPWITPHLPVALTSRAYFKNEDPVLRAVLHAIRTGRFSPT